MTQKQLLISLGVIFLLLVMLGIAFFSLVTGNSAANVYTIESKTGPTNTPLTGTAPTTTTTTEATLPAAATAIPIQSTSTPLALPESFYIKDIVGHRQTYHLGCEASAAVDWAGYFGVPIIEYTFQVGLPHSDNPDFGFVGDVNSVWGQVPPYAYGVYSGPVADLLRDYDLPADSVKNYTLEQVKQKLSESKPIIVWVIGNMVWSPATEYVDSQGNKTIVAAYEHVVILTGYDQGTIRYMSNGVFYDTPTDVFLKSWGVLGNMAVVHE